ncbi:transposase [Chryseobacterium sp. c4a]|uniref:transposase n=1 Tax=Chryseobacterium sp. c4a TaxID=1573582 RepID=UPI001356CEF8|nr:transposase [Chryseobacterium sp. c4a]
MNYKNIHIGNLIENAVSENSIELSRICKFLRCTEKQVQEMYASSSLNTEILLQWSKLLEYDFFRIYSQHMILYAPTSSKIKSSSSEEKKTILPRFRKNIYTQEVIDFILEQIMSGEMTREEVLKRYRIPKTTLHKWIGKYSR